MLLLFCSQAFLTYLHGAVSEPTKSMGSLRHGHTFKRKDDGWRHSLSMPTISGRTEARHHAAVSPAPAAVAVSGNLAGVNFSKLHFKALIIFSRKGSHLENGKLVACLMIRQQQDAGIINLFRRRTNCP